MIEIQLNPDKEVLEEMVRESTQIAPGPEHGSGPAYGTQMGNGIIPEKTTVRDVVVDDYRTAAVFQKYGLDFCCGGGAPIAEAAANKNVDTKVLLAELETVRSGGSDNEPRVTEWGADFLAEFIVQNHHRYVQSVLPAIRQHANKVAKVHGAAHPETIEIARLFNDMANDLESHMRKEETVLFPWIKALVAANPGQDSFPAPGTVANPVRMMEAEHEVAGETMRKIRRLSSDYTPPPEACMTYRVLYQELREFETDLHRHVHLENNILFPKALPLEGAFRDRDAGNHEISAQLPSSGS